MIKNKEKKQVSDSQPSRSQRELAELAAEATQISHFCDSGNIFLYATQLCKSLTLFLFILFLVYMIGSQKAQKKCKKIGLNIFNRPCVAGAVL